MEKICERCDAKNDLYSVDCKNCGLKFYESKNNKKSNRSKKSRVCFLIFGFVIPLLIVSVYFFGLYQYLYGIENYNSEVYLKQYIELIQNKNYEAIAKYINFEETKFNYQEQLVEYIKREYGEELSNIRIMKDTKLSNKDIEYYKVKFGNKIKEFKLCKTGEKKMYYFDTWYVDIPESNIYTESVKVYSPIGIDIYINGDLVTDEYVNNEEETLKYYSGIKDENIKEPKIICYEVKNLLALTEVQAKHKNGDLCVLERDETSHNVYTVDATIPSDEIEPIKSLAMDVAKKYAAYIAEDCKLSDLSDYIYKNTEFYDTVREFYNGWFPEHDSFNYENEQFEKIKWYDENHCSVQVKFTYYITYKGGKRRDYPVAYELYFVKKDGNWMVSNIMNY